MELAKDIVDKYTTEQIIAELDHTLGGVVQSYKAGLKTGRAEFLWSSFGDIVQIKDILHEMKGCIKCTPFCDD